MNKPIVFVWVLIGFLFDSCQTKPSFLTSLNAGKRFPIYTTYAAAQQRSDFILDEGYEFRYDTDSLGADFTTDTGGDLCIGFLKDGKWVYRIPEMVKPPVITTSFPDMVKYESEPFPGINVSALFMTYSSRSALLDLTITNNGKDKSEVTLVPFMRSNRRTFHSVSLNKREGMISFSHEEYPDGWTLSHNLPHTDSIRNVFMLSPGENEAFAFSSESGESPAIPSPLFLSRKPTRQLTGRLYSPDGVRLTGTAPLNRLQLMVDDNQEIILTENSSLWGTTQPTLALDGYFSLEGGNINPGAKTFRLTGFNETEQKQATVTGTFKDETQRCDLHLSESALPVISSVKAENNRIVWTRPSHEASFSVYRRSYPEITYHRIAKEINDSSFTDTTADQEKIYGYVVTCSVKGRAGIHSREVVNIQASDFSRYLMEAIPPDKIPDHAKIVTLVKKLQIAPGKSERVRIVRSVSGVNEPGDSLLDNTKKLLKADLSSLVKANEKLLAKVKTFGFRSQDQEALFWSNVNMMRQCFYPPQAKSAYNYYVFSREPTWGWGHGGQVFHESIVMLSYADVDPEGAMNSQRVYLQRQYPNGYINYRTGSYLDEIIEYKGELTSSAPWYSWLNWEVYKMTRDKNFLSEMYGSSAKFYNFYVGQRDKDGDGLCEWGGHAVLESVRDALVAVWDEVGWPASFEALDLNCMLVMEAKSLEAMARELGREDEAAKWKADHEKRAALINRYCWDQETGFYYNVNKDNHSFTFKTANDLKRMEIIGFLPLWAGIADQEQAKSLVSHLTNPGKFWRRYGIPSLAADDSYYNDKGYWNGPVWVQWNYLVMRGLLNYGYQNEATELVGKVTAVMSERLAADHNLWEFYSPDNSWGGHHKTYIWAGIINRMMKDVSEQEFSPR